MINDYNEFCNYIEWIYNEDEHLKIKNGDPDYLSRMVNVLARKFVYPFEDEEDPTHFKNDYYNLIIENYNNKTKNSKKRLKYAISAITYLYTGVYNGELKSIEKFYRYLYNDLKDVPYGLDILEKYKKQKPSFNPNLLPQWKIYEANKDAVIEGPLRKQIGIKYKIEEVNKIFSKYKNDDDKIDYDSARVAVMALSYYYFMKDKTDDEYIRLSRESLKLWYGRSGDNYYTNTKKKCFINNEFVNLEDFENLKKESGYYASDNDFSKSIKPEIIVVNRDKTESYITDDGLYFVFVDEGQSTFKNLKMIFKRYFA